MTPGAQRLFKDAATMARYPHLRESGVDLMEMLAKAVCFDLSAVDQLVGTTIANTREEHGGLFVPPAETFVLESRCAEGVRLFLCQKIEGDILSIEVPGREGRALIVWSDEKFERVSPKLPEASWVMWVAAAVVLLNAPYGIERETKAPHKGLARQVRHEGLGDLRPAYTVKLSLSAPPSEHLGGEGSPKAFHFCRGHARTLASGAVTKVRAHWRGDPRLGICPTPDYSVGA